MITRHKKKSDSGTVVSTNPSDYQEKIQQLLAKKEFNSALTLCHAAIDAIPDGEQPDWQVQSWLGDALLGLGRWEEAISLYRSALTIRPNTADTYRKMAIALSQLGRLGEADNSYAQFLKKEPDFKAKIANDFVAQRQAGDFFFRQNKFQAAADAYKQAIAIEPNDGWTYINLGRVLHHTGLEKAAISTLRKAIEINNQNSLAYYHLSTILLAQKEYKAAQQCCQQAIDLEPNGNLLKNLLAEINLAANSQQSKAITTITEKEPVSATSASEVVAVIETQPLRLEPFQVQYSQGQQLFAEGRFEDAHIAYRNAVKLNPDFYVAYCGLGNALFELNKFAEAALAYQQALALQPRLPHVSDKLNRAVQKQHEQQPVPIKQCLEALSKDFQSAALRVALADAFYRYSYVDDAISQYQTAIALMPANTSASVASAIQQKLEQAIARRERLHQAFYSPTVVPADYAAWVLESAPELEHLSIMPAAVCNFKYQPVISILVPTYNPPESALREMIQSVLDQIYPYWELCIADDCSTQPHVRSIIEEYARLDSRIKPVFRTQNGHISAASNSAATIATGEFISLLDHDDELTPDALYEVVSLINQHPDADMIYSDEDKRLLTGERADPYFKPDWSPDTFLSRMYVCHLGTYRRRIFERIGGFRLGFEGSQDYDLVLRFTEKTQNIFHIPKVLYHWRVIESSVTSGAEAKPYAYKAAIKALTEALVRRGEHGRIEMNPQVPGIYIPRYEIKDYKLVSIIIPTRNLGNVLDTCLRSIFEKTTYPNYEIILLDNGSDEPETLALIQRWKNRAPVRFQHILYDVPFNYSKINNYAASRATGDYFLFLNNDTEIITPGWIEGMVEQAQRSSIGAVGAKMYYEDDTLQHGGVVLGIGDAAGHSHRHAHRDDFGYVGQLIALNNYSAVTAACLMCRRDVFESVGGFEEALGVAFNDVELCIKIQNAGYRNVWLPHVELYHYESKSRGYEDTPEKIARLQREAKILRAKWGEVIDNDPCYNLNLTRAREDYSIKAVFCGDVVEVNQAVLAQGSPVLKSWLDSPQVGRFTAVTQISGWVIGKTCAVKEVEVVASGLVMGSTTDIHPRADVAAVYPNSEFSLDSGFRVQCNLLELPPDTKLDVIVTLADGSVVQIASFQIRGDKKAGGALSQHTHYRQQVKPAFGKAKAKLSTASFQEMIALQKQLVSVSDVSIRYDESQIFKSHIDSPKPCNDVKNINISGWILSVRHEVESIGIFQDETALKIVNVDVPRVDVASIYPNIIGSEQCGFHAQIEAKEIAANCSQLKVKGLLDRNWLEISTIELSRR